MYSTAALRCQVFHRCLRCILQLPFDASVPHDDVEDEEDDYKNAKTGETNIYCEFKIVFHLVLIVLILGKLYIYYWQLLVVYSLAILATIALQWVTAW